MTGLYIKMLRTKKKKYKKRRKEMDGILDKRNVKYYAINIKTIRPRR